MGMIEEAMDGKALIIMIIKVAQDNPRCTWK